MKFEREWKWNKKLVIESSRMITMALCIAFLCGMVIVGCAIFRAVSGVSGQSPPPVIPKAPAGMTMKAIEEVERIQWLEVVGPSKVKVGQKVQFDAFVHESIPGDANCDGKVNLMDYMILEIFWLQTTGHITWRQGDFNLDGIVDLKDYIIFEQHYGLEIPFEGVTVALAKFGRGVKYEDISKHMILNQQF